MPESFQRGVCVHSQIHRDICSQSNPQRYILDYNPPIHFRAILLATLGHVVT